MSGFDGTEVKELLNTRPKGRIASKDLPDIREQHWQLIEENKACLEWLKEFNCLTYYKKHKNAFMYDPKQNRLVFLIKHEDKYIDGAGRLLKPASPGNPKWYRYGSSGLGYYAEHKFDPTQRILDPIVIVEDAASACSVARLYSSFALLGTSVTTEQLIFLNTLEHSDVIIALDKDAIVNATAVQQELGSYGYNVTIIQLRDDAKYLSLEELKTSLTFR